MMDAKIAEVKDFVGEVVKKLPQPCKLEVVGGVRKTLVLHFACSATGATVTAAGAASDTSAFKVCFPETR